MSAARLRAALALTIVGLLLAGADAARTAEPPPFAPRSFAYVLQADSFQKKRAAAVQSLAAGDRDLLVLDAHFAGGTDSAWRRAELDTLRNARAGRRIVAYLSIGEAEDYRTYWRKEWVRAGGNTAAAPAWLCAVNPEWKGNYKVKYWHADWQRLLLRAVDDIAAQGFDGIYLDIVDGFEFFEQDGKKFVTDRENPETRQSFRRDMVDWVLKIAAQGRAARVGFLVLPQNGSQLLAHKDFLGAVDGIGIEDLFTNGNRAQPKAHTREVLAHLAPLQAAGKPVLVIEYATQPKLQQAAREQAHTHGLVLLLTDRELKTLGESAGGRAGKRGELPAFNAQR